ncbi:MAG TPA: ATP-binding protein [Thermoanaerobaculia bacterium]|jgi:signal transduction histidine kinase|nr:ATP-binding protein [Thermoanaerobaculia bacterium]
MASVEQLREDLKQVPIFSDLGDEELTWLAGQFTEKWLEPGEASVVEGSPADRMMVLLEGELQVRREKGPSDGWIDTLLPPAVSGMLPFSRMTTFGVTARAVRRTRLLWLPAALFPEMLRRIPALEPRLVALLTDRVREWTRLDQQREKLAALGKLSAGLAHELNNPAAAVQRSASELRDRMVALRGLVAGLVECGLTPQSMNATLALYRQAIERSRARPASSEPDPIALSDQEDALAAWLEAHRVERPEVVAGTLAQFGVEPRDLEELGTAAPDVFLPCLVSWMEGGLAAEGLLSEIANAARRISELVSAIKSYSHMDSGQGRSEVDLRRELESTLTILAHKLRKKGVEVTRDYQPDLPPVEAFPGELNQVWTNLIDNAVDAVAPGGHVTVRATREGDFVRVDVRDDGPGIPADIKARIWEPFFTTKPVGEGTGLGLEVVGRIVVRRHGGTISVASVPGDTCFTVRLPLTPPLTFTPPAPTADSAGGSAASASSASSASSSSGSAPPAPR